MNKEKEMRWDECTISLPVAPLRPGVLSLVIVGVIIIRDTLMRSGDNHRAFNLRFSSLLCFAPRNSWNENATLLVKFCFVLFPLNHCLSTVECQKIILGFSEFSVARGCAGLQTVVPAAWKESKESSKKWQSRSGDRLKSEREDVTTPTDGVAFTSFPFVRS